MLTKNKLLQIDDQSLLIVGYSRGPKKIIGGHPALPGQFKHQVLLRVHGLPICGGSIINPTHILTAAHCVVSAAYVVTPADGIEVVTGTTDSYDQRADHVFRVRRVIPHGDFRPTLGLLNDIAILKVN